MPDVRARATIVFFSFLPHPMHGSYTHRVTCNLHAEQFYELQRVARRFNSRLAPFLREAALAYLAKRFLIPPQLHEQLTRVVQEVRRVGTNLNQIAVRANTYQRLTHDDLRRAAKLVVQLERQIVVLRHAVETLPRDRQIDES